jgi:outer membrane murein-binding lipoprotein Lpp
VIEIYAAILGASIGIAGMSVSGFTKRTSESREAVIRLTAAVESIAGKLEELHQDMKADRKEIYTRLNQHGERITVLENKQR